MINKSEKRYEISPNGDCPRCLTKVKLEKPPKKIFKGRLFITDSHTNEIEIKCPNTKCKVMLISYR